MSCRGSTLRLAAILCLSMPGLACSAGEDEPHVTVPLVTQTDIPSAYERLREAGLRVTIRETFSVASLQTPRAARQWPRSGTRVARGSTVSIRAEPGPIGSPAVREGLPGAEVPELTGMTVSDALERVEDLDVGLFWEVRDLQPLSDAEAARLFDNYHVARQAPPAGTMLRAGTRRGGGFRPTPVVLWARRSSSPPGSAFVAASDVSVTGGTPRHRLAARSTLAGMGESSLRAVRFLRPKRLWRPHPEHALALIVEPVSRSVRASWEAELLAAGVQERLLRAGLEPLVAFESHGSGVRLTGPALDRSPRPPRLRAGDRARVEAAVEHAARTADAHVLTIRLPAPYGLAVVATIAVRDPARFVHERLDTLTGSLRALGFDGEFVTVVDTEETWAATIAGVNARGAMSGRVRTRPELRGCILGFASPAGPGRSVPPCPLEETP